MDAEAELRDWNLDSLQDAALLLAGVNTTPVPSTRLHGFPRFSLFTARSSSIDSRGGEVLMLVERVGPDGFASEI